MIRIAILSLLFTQSAFAACYKSEATIKDTYMLMAELPEKVCISAIFAEQTPHGPVLDVAGDVIDGEFPSRKEVYLQKDLVRIEVRKNLLDYRHPHCGRAETTDLVVVANYDFKNEIEVEKLEIFVDTTYSANVCRTSFERNIIRYNLIK